MIHFMALQGFEGIQHVRPPVRQNRPGRMVPPGNQGFVATLSYR
jgi:hypothetical protein